MRVVGPGSKPGLWAVECTHCGRPYEKDALALRVTKSQKSKHCVACRPNFLPPPVRQSDLLSFEYRTPAGVLAQRLICRGLVVR